MQRVFNWIPYLAIAGALAAPGFAQTDSRAAEIAAQQDQKAANIRPDETNWLERAMLRFRDGAWLERVSTGINGFRPKVGGMGAGTGFGIGPEYRRTDLLGGKLTFHGSTQASFQQDYRFDIGLEMPKIANGKYFAEIYAVHHDYPRLPFYGTGPNSEKTGRTDFRLDDSAVDGTIGMRPARNVTIGASAGYLFNNIGPGKDGRFASAETVYSPSQAPGIDVQTNYFRAGAFAQYDWRDNPDGARKGGNYFAQLNQYSDQRLGASSFHRLDMEAQQYIPVLNERRVLAFRAKSTLTFADGESPIPFYMQPSLGGSEDLRGYRLYRFRGDNLMVMNAEYRWEVFSGLDMAVFGDAGQVFNHKSDFRWSALESDVGFGFRFNAKNRTFLRLDVGFSHEGFQVWVKFNNIFKKGPVHTSSIMGEF